MNPESEEGRRSLERWRAFRGRFQRKTGWVLHLCAHIGLPRAQTALWLDWTLTHDGGDVHERDAKGYQGIHHVCLRNHLESLEVLLRHGADVSVRSGPRGHLHRSGDLRLLPIDCAVMHNADRCIRRLIEAGSPVSGRPEPQWAREFREERRALRHKVMVLLVSRFRGRFRGHDRYLVRDLAQRAWEMRQWL